LSPKSNRERPQGPDFDAYWLLAPVIVVLLAVVAVLRVLF